MARRVASRFRQRFLPGLVAACLPGLGAAGEADMPTLPAVAEKVIVATYACRSGNRLSVRYDNSVADQPVAKLEYLGRTFDLYSVRSGSGARYATERGLTADKGLQWWVKGDEATLSEMLMDHTAPEPTLIETCKVLKKD